MTDLFTFPVATCAACGSQGCNRIAGDGRYYCNAACQARGPFQPKRKTRMAKELRIDVRVPIPDDLFAGAEALAKIKPLVDQMTAGIEALGGSISHDVVTPRGKSGGE